MSQLNHQYFLNECFKLANSAVKKGNHPFGALLVLNGQIVLSCENKVSTMGDKTAHAELLLVQQAQKFLTSDQLGNSTLYTSTEPCAMCSGAIYWAGVREVVYACSTKELYKIVGSGLYVRAGDIYSQSSHPVKVWKASTDGESQRLHEKFW